MRIHQRFFLLVIAGSLIALAACDSDSDPVTPPPAASGDDAGVEAAASTGRDSVDQFCVDIWTKLCAGRQTCAPNAFADWHHGDINDCVKRNAEQCVRFKTNFASASPEVLKSCVATVDPTSCTDHFEIVEGHRDCSGLGVVGPLADGAPCLDHGQCKSAGCKFAPGNRCGTCSPVVAPGGSCAGSQPCSSGNVCINGSCGPWGVMGATCSSGGHCNPALVCDAATRKCVSSPAPGTACNLQMDKGCGPQNSCNEKTQKCELVVTMPNGAACGVLADSGSLANCAAGSKCKLEDPKTFRGQCVTEIADGQRCTGLYFFGGPCHWPAQCRDGICQLAEPNLCPSTQVLSVAATVCSDPGAALATADITWVNYTERDISVFWVDPTCKEIPYGIVPANTQFVQGTFEGHAWRIRDPDTNELLKDNIKATRGPQEVSFR